jgi:hypothetical protein
MVDLLERVGRPQTLGFQADMAHTLLYTLGYNAPEDRIVPENFNWEPAALDDALRKLTAALRPWTIDFHVAQNDATVHGAGTHDKTGRHCLVNDPGGKLNIPKHAGFWLRDERGQLTKAIRHVCWDGCMFPNAVMMNQQTWNDILATMIAVRDIHGWGEDGATTSEPVAAPAAVVSKPARPAAPKAVKAKARPAKKKTARKPAKKAAKVKARKTARKPAKKSRKPAAKKKASKKGRRK